MEKTKPISICKLTYYSERERFRVEIYHSARFPSELKQLVPYNARNYLETERYWLIEPRYFYWVIQLVKKHFDKVILFANNYATTFDLKQINSKS